MLESADPKRASDFAKWMEIQRGSQKEPKRGDSCVLAMVVNTDKMIYVYHGSADYVGQTDTHYKLKTERGINEYSKEDQIVFDSVGSFEKFVTLLTLKFGGEDIGIETKKLPVMETEKNKKNDDGCVEEGLEDPEDNPCWKGYHPVGTKKKQGRTVPNCVPNDK